MAGDERSGVGLDGVVQRRLLVAERCHVGRNGLRERAKIAQLTSNLPLMGRQCRETSGQLLVVAFGEFVQRLLFRGDRGDQVGQVLVGLVELMNPGICLLLVVRYGRDALDEFLLVVLHELMECRLVSRDRAHRGVGALCDIGDVGYAVLQRRLVVCELGELGVHVLVVRGHSLVELSLLALDGGDSGIGVLEVLFEAGETLLDPALADVDLRGERGQLAGIGGHHGLKLDLVLLHPGHLIAAAGGAERGGHQSAEQDRYDDGSPCVESLPCVHRDSFPTRMTTGFRLASFMCVWREKGSRPHGCPRNDVTSTEKGPITPFSHRSEQLESFTFYGTGVTRWEF